MRTGTLLAVCSIFLAACGSDSATEAAAEPEPEAVEVVATAETTETAKPEPGSLEAQSLEMAEDAPEAWEGPDVKELTSMDDLDEVVKASNDKPFFVFKHSTQCPVSARAAARVNEYVDGEEKDLPEFRMVKVIESRPVSQEIEKKLGVKHESPQILLLRDGKAVWSTSHQDITAESMNKAIEEHLKSL